MRRTLAYWIPTALFSLAFTASAVQDLVHADAIMAGLAHLGYPAYLASFLGVLKLAGVAAILAPGTPRLKEWAYAGITFELLGASYSHLSSGDPTKYVVTPLVLLAVALGSWALRPSGRPGSAWSAPSTDGPWVATPASATKSLGRSPTRSAT